jgi:hypothetical protein
MTMRGLDQSSDTERSNTLAAIFATGHDAREAIKELHKARFRTTWIGTMREFDRDSGEPTVESAGNPLARFFSAGADRRPLHKVLIERGLTVQQAEQIESDVAIGMSVLTVYGEDNPDRASELLSEAHGQVIGGLDDAPPAVLIASEDPRTGVDRKTTDRTSSGETQMPGNGSGRDGEYVDSAEDADDVFAVEEFYTTRR